MTVSASLESLSKVLIDVVAERARQDAKFPEQVGVDIPDVDPADHIPGTNFPSEGTAKRSCDAAFTEGRPTWLHILFEEVAEIYAPAVKGDQEKLRAELVQVAAVAVKWIEALDARGGEATGTTVGLDRIFESGAAFSFTARLDA